MRIAVSMRWMHAGAGYFILQIQRCCSVPLVSALELNHSFEEWMDWKVFFLIEWVKCVITPTINHPVGFLWISSHLNDKFLYCFQHNALFLIHSICYFVKRPRHITSRVSLSWDPHNLWRKRAYTFRNQPSATWGTCDLGKQWILSRIRFTERWHATCYTNKEAATAIRGVYPELWTRMRMPQLNLKVHGMFVWM